MATLIATPFGASALEALAESVSSAKAGDPLAPVAVVVPSERMAVSARRGLARAGIGDRGGIAGVSVLTLRRLAESIATAALTASGRLPTTDTVLLAALDRVLADAPGAFTEVADHPDTARALAGAHHSLRVLPSTVVEVIGHTSSLLADVVRLHRETSALLSSRHYDAVDILHTATDLVVDGGADLCPVVLHLPEEPDPPSAAFVDALARSTDLRVIVGVTGDTELDEPVLAAWQAVLPEAGLQRAPAAGAGLADMVIAATDPDAEVRAVVRHLNGRLAAGTPGHRIAVLYGSRDPYARLIAEHLAGAGVTFNGRGVRPASERILGRAIRRLLALPDTDFRRDAVMAVLADAPIRWEGAPVPSTEWERLSREAGVVRGPDWQDRLTDLAARRRAAAGRARAAADWDGTDAGPDPGAFDKARAADAERLAAFVADLRSRLAALAGASSWTEACRVLADLWRNVLGGEALRLPEDEVRVAEVLERTIRSLPALDPLGAEVSLAAVREIVELDLGAALDRVGRSGVGVHVGPIGDGVGQHLDAVYVLGMAEGMFPARPVEDPLLPDAARALTDGVLPTLRARIDRQSRQFLAALESAPAGSAAAPARVLSFPRGDLRRGGVRVPSRWLVPTLRAMADDPALVAIGWESLIGKAPGLQVEASYPAGVTGSAQPASDQEWRQRNHAAGGAVGPDVAAARGLEMRAARRSGTLTRYDGLVGAHPALAAATTGVLSPTSLETWFSCPHRYLMRQVLGVREVEAPEEIIEISALDSGSVMHAVFERFVADALAAGTQPRDGAPWPPDDVERLDRIIDEEFARVAASGRAGLSGLWETAARRMRADLRALLEQDDRRRRGDALTPLAAEMAFGQHGLEPIEVDLGIGRSLRLCGSIDRVDQRPDGSLVILDYKTGKASPYKDLAAADPTAAGRFLQLPLYALAARTVLGRPEVRADVAYWFITRRAKYELRGYEADDAVLAAATEVLRVAVDGITQGLFPSRPVGHSGAYGCAYCDPDGLGERTSAEQFDALLDATDALADYRDLLRGQHGRAGAGTHGTEAS